MSFSPPKAPDPMQTAGQQQQFNIQAGTEQNKINSYNQSNPYSSMNFVADPSSPSGYRIETSLSAPQQRLLDTQTANQGQAGGQVGGYLSGASAFRDQATRLGQNTAGMYANAPNFTPLDPTGLVTTLNNWQQKYQQPLFDQQSSNLEAQLRSQGLTPGSEAYNNAKNLLARNQGDVTNQFMTNNIGVGQQAQAQNFGQQVTNYELPLQTESALLGNAGALNQNAGALASYAQPQGGMFQQAPNASIQPANYQGAVQANYDAQMKNYENTWNNIGKLGTAGIGLATSPGSFFGGMFGGSPTGTAIPISGSYDYGGIKVPQVGGGWSI